MFALKNLCLQTPAQRRHGRRVLIASLAYAAALIPTVYVIKHGLVTGGWRMALALIPAVPMVAMFTSYARYLSEETDVFFFQAEDGIRDPPPPRPYRRRGAVPPVCQL